MKATQSGKATDKARLLIDLDYNHITNKENKIAWAYTNKISNYSVIYIFEISFVKIYNSSPEKIVLFCHINNHLSPNNPKNLELN